MGKQIRKAGVLGAGVMGATIAAQLANVGIETLLVDIVPRELSEADRKQGLKEESKAFRDKLGRNGLQTALKSRPASFYLPENARLVTVGNLEDDLESLGKVDWIVEAVVERLDIKQAVFGKLEAVMGAETIVTSNTSGISARAMCEGRSEQFRQHFAITHFFNPPRYMKLLEIVRGPDTLPEVVELLAETCEKVVGKGIVYAKDTPNFIANRIGTFSMFSVIQAMLDLNLGIEAVDQLTGPVVGNPKSASFRTADLVGLDTLLHVADNVYEGAPEDERRETFSPPEFVRQMVEHKLLGEKTKQGFYKKARDSKGKKTILTLDCKTLEYRPREKVKIASLETAKNISGTAEKLKALYYADDPGGQFTFRTLSETLIYSANRIPEIADDIVNVDNAMKWGFGRRMGPFEAWDAIGVARSVKRMKKAGYEIPAWVQQMLDSGTPSFYKTEAGQSYYYDPAARAVPGHPGQTGHHPAAGPQRPQQEGGREPGRLPDRPRRRGCLPGISHQDERHRRRSDPDAQPGRRYRKPGFRRPGDRQPFDQLFRRRQPGDGPVRGPGRGMGRPGLGDQEPAERAHETEVSGQTGGGCAGRHGPGRRLRGLPGRRPGALRGRDLHGPGGGGGGPDPGRRRHQGAAAAQHRTSLRGAARAAFTPNRSS